MRREPARHALLEEAMQPPRRDPFEIDLFPLLRDAMAEQSRRAIEMALAAGVEAPCARPTT